MGSSHSTLLLQAAQAGDRAALEALLAEEQARIFRFGMKMCRQQQDAEDILQETMLAASQSIGNFHGESSLATWLYTIARSFCIKKRRQSKFAPSTLESLDAQAGEAEGVAYRGKTPDEEAQNRELQESLKDALQTLEPEAREVLVLRDMEGLKASEVAQVLRIGVPAVKSRLHRARKALREALAPVLQAPQVARAATCPDVLAGYSQQLEGELSGHVCAEMEKHLESCPTCRAVCESLKQTLALCSAYPDQEVPQAVQESVRTALMGLRTPPA